MKKRLRLCLLALLSLLLFSGCSEQAKIERVQKTALPDCKGMTMQTLTADILQDPLWGLEKTSDGKEVVTVRGTLAGEKLPAWVKEQKLMDITFRFPLDPKTGAYDPSALGGFPSLNAPEGILQAYKALVCR